MDLERGFLSISFASAPGVAAEDALDADRMEMEAAEILAALAHSKKRVAVAVSAEFAAKWGCKGKRVRKRASTRSESPPSDVGSNPVQSVSDLAEDQATAGREQSQVTSTTVVVESREAESLNSSHPCTAGYTSNGVVRSRQNVTEILFSTVGMPEKDIWEDSQQDEDTGNNAIIKPVKAVQNAESVKSSPACATKHMAGGGGRSRQNLTEAEKEARRLRRILANRESARQTIRRRQALCEKLTIKVTDLTQENESLKRAKELALKEYQSQEITNKHLKAEVAKAMKPEEGKTAAEVKLDHQISGPSRNYPYFFYNQHPFPPFCWPSVVQSSHPVQSQCGHQNAIFVPSSISSLTDGTLDSSHYQENTKNVNGPETALYVVPYPWFFPLPDHRSGLHPHFSCGPKDIEDETSVNKQFSAGCSVVNEEKYNSCMPVEVEEEAYGSIETSSNNPNHTPVRLPPDGGGQCVFHIKEEVIVATPLCSAGTAFVVEQENNHVVNSEEAPKRAFQFVGALPEENQESTSYTSKKALDAVAAAEARKRRKELTKLKNLHGRQRTPFSLSAKT